MVWLWAHGHLRCWYVHVMQEGGEYGTRSQTVLLVKKDGSAELQERSRNAGSWQTVQHSFQMTLASECGVNVPSDVAGQ